MKTVLVGDFRLDRVMESEGAYAPLDSLLESAYGHTPGACFMHAKSRGAHAVLIGDVAHTPVRLAMPSLSSFFCFDAAASAKTRIAMCERYADTATTILAAHFPTPVAARIKRHRDAFLLDAD